MAMWQADIFLERRMRTQCGRARSCSHLAIAMKQVTSGQQDSSEYTRAQWCVPIHGHQGGPGAVALSIRSRILSLFGFRLYVLILVYIQAGLRSRCKVFKYLFSITTTIYIQFYQRHIALQQSCRSGRKAGEWLTKEFSTQPRLRE